MSYESLQQLASAIRDRRTIKIFEQRAVDHNIIRDAIEVARWAPNHHLTEPWHFYLLNDDASLNEYGLHYKGKDRFLVRNEIAKELDSLGLLIKTERITNEQ